MSSYTVSFVLSRKFSTFPSRAFISLKDTLLEQIPKKKDAISTLRAKYANVKVGDITVGSILGGMRGNTSIYWQGTTLDPYHGIRFQGYTIEECQTLLPKSMDSNSKHPNFLVESMLWLLMTGKVPSSSQVQSLVSELGIRGKTLPKFAIRIIDNLPPTMHPMNQLAIGIASLSSVSLFSKKYHEGTIGKNDYWHYIFEDTLTLVALLPSLVGKIYANSTNNGKPLGEFNSERDWSYNLSSAFGMTFKDSLNVQNLSEQQCEDFTELIRLYCGIHSDHEGGNVSAHTTHLVGSALSDPFLSYSSGVMGLAGPLHGLAAQEVVRFLKDMGEAIDSPNNEEQIESYIWSILHSHRVVPGYGHAVLRKTDPRFSAMVRFTRQRNEEFKKDEYVQLMINLSEYVPKILLEHGKIKNPYPNVDSASGIIFHHYGIKDLLFITVIFACSRAIGPLTQLVWDRILGLPIERPKSLDLQKLESMCLANGSNR